MDAPQENHVASEGIFSFQAWFKNMVSEVFLSWNEKGNYVVSKGIYSSQERREVIM